MSLSDFQDLQDLLWPWLDLDEERVVRKSKYQGTKFAFGGAITMEQKEMKGSAQGSVKYGTMPIVSDFELEVWQAAPLSSKLVRKVKQCRRWYWEKNRSDIGDWKLHISTH